jgi:hypothetical protein
MNSTWAEQNEGAIVDALAKSLDVWPDQIQIVSISPVGDVPRRLEAGDKVSNGFRIHFTVDVVEEEAIAKVTNAVDKFLEPDSNVHESFVNELQSELESRNVPVPAEIKTLQPLSANKEVWLRGSTFFTPKSERHSASWIVGGWMPCEGSCGTSMQNRSVECSSEDAAVCAALGPRPPRFRECKHRSPCPIEEHCKFGCSLQWWAVVVALTLPFICACLCVCRQKPWRMCGKKKNSKKIAQSDVKTQATHSIQPGMQSRSIPAEAPTLLRSSAPEEVKTAPFYVPAAGLDTSDVELGNVSAVKNEISEDPLSNVGKSHSSDDKPQLVLCQEPCSVNVTNDLALETSAPVVDTADIELGNVSDVTNDLDQWLMETGFDMVQQKIPAVPAVCKPE